MTTTIAPTPEAIARIVARVDGMTRRRIEEDAITAETDLDEIGVDEIDLMAIELELHDEYRVTICESDMERAQTVGDLVRLVEARKGEG